MSNKFFQPVDFSDFEPITEVIEKKRENYFVIPSIEVLEDIKKRLISEFERCEKGTSKLTRYAIQATTTNITKNTMELLFNDFTQKNLTNFIQTIKQDYGFLVAEWAATELFSQIYPEILNEVNRNITYDQTDKS